MNIIFLGAPGAGKGTQAAVVCEYLKIPTISTGNIIREALRTGTEMGLKAKSYMDAGKLVPDSVIIDGFPRTIPQAEALDKMGVVIDKVIDIEVDDEVIINRMSGRRVCEKCGRPYHLVSLKPKVDGVCDDCAGALVQRKDDQIDTVKDRLEVYHKETEPLKDYYSKQGKLVIVEGQDTVEATSKLVLAQVEA